MKVVATSSQDQEVYEVLQTTTVGKLKIGVVNEEFIIFEVEYYDNQTEILQSKKIPLTCSLDLYYKISLMYQ